MPDLTDTSVYEHVEIDLTPEVIEIDLTDFLAALKELCNEYGIEIAGCSDCEAAIIQAVEKPIEAYHIEDGHLIPYYAPLALMA